MKKATSSISSKHLIDAEEATNIILALRLPPGVAGLALRIRRRTIEDSDG